ncbi:MAG: VRR-NUC domain-containing protein, partial [Candidatus Scalindua sp.]|nr:VRR-NUC domain-containing protein [Candidatus Scalindua sp.]
LIAIPKDSDVKFVEVKKPNGKVSKLQEYRIDELRKHGVSVEIYKGQDI